MIEREACPWTVAMAQTECDWILSPNPLWGGLEPRYPLASCAVLQSSLARLSNPLFFYTSDGGMLRPSYRYVVYREGRLQEIHTLTELQTLYAPITTANEALSYAMVATGLDADFRDKLDGDRQNYHFYGMTLENTYSKPIKGGYQVLLYHTSWPCEMTMTTAELVTVMQDGTLLRSTPKPVYKHLLLGYCAD